MKTSESIGILADTEQLARISSRAQAYADWFRLPLTDRTWRGNAGDFAGSGVGSSLDFQDHRTYLPGDDPRHINWQAYARTGSYSMKLYREEVRPIVEIIIDVSDSLFFDEQKALRTLELFYFCYHSVMQASAATNIFLVKGDQQSPTTPEAVYTHQWTALAQQMEATDSAAPPNLRPLPLRAQSLRILISDLLFAEHPEATVRELTRAKGSALIFCPYLQAEAQPTWDGNYEFIDAETTTTHDHRIDSGLLKRYLSAYQNHFAAWKETCQKYAIPLARVASEADYDKAIQQEAIAVGAVQMG